MARDGRDEPVGGGGDPEGGDEIPTAVSPPGLPHTYGPAPMVPPSHGLGFRSKDRTAELPSEAQDHAVGRVEPVMPAPDSPAVEVPPDEYRPRHARAVESAHPLALHPASPVQARPVADPADPPARVTSAGKHRRERSAISGTVRSTRGRGLRDMQVVVLDEHWQVITTAVTGTGGVFIAEDVPPGACRVMATDELDGDFGAGWHDSSGLANAGLLQVKQGRTRRNIDITLASSATVDLEVDVRRKKAVVEVRVTERATGVRANGSVRVTTKWFGAELPLSKGRTAFTLLGSPDGSPRLGKKVRVHYLGTKHVQPGSASARLR